MNKKIVSRTSNSKKSFGEKFAKIFLCFVLPYFIINGFILFLFIQTPKIHTLESDSKDYEEGKIKFYIESALPIIDIKTFFHEDECAYSKLGNYYIIDAKNNGTYQIIATSLNKAAVNLYINIETHDVDAPTINTDDASIIGNILSFTVNDTQSGINYDNIYATDENDNTVSPSYIDKASGTVQFHIDSIKKLIIHVEDVNGNAVETTFAIGD